MTTNDWQILVVEDEEDSLELVQELFHHYSIHTIGASSGEEALRILETQTPTLIIIDLSLPGIDGWGLLNTIKSKRTLANIPRVAITAYHTAEVANRAIEKGFDAYFSKPLDATSFVREIERIIGS